MRGLAALGRAIGVEIVAVRPIERVVAALGGGLAILVLLVVGRWAAPGAGAVVVVASMGASAVLLFAVPHGPLSQPWPVLAGNGISALIGVFCARHIGSLPVAAACAVGLSIGAMHLLRCIHPPGGATALTAVVGGEAIRALGYGYVLAPVLADAVLMVALAALINAPFPWRRYPASWTRPKPPTPPPPGPSHEEVVAALRGLDSFVDISEEDLTRLVEALSRRPSRPGASSSASP